jgi:hypothetical protein
MHETGAAGKRVALSLASIAVQVIRVGAPGVLVTNDGVTDCGVCN